MGQQFCAQCEDTLQKQNPLTKNCCEIVCANSEKSSKIETPLQAILFSDRDSNPATRTKGLSFQMSKVSSQRSVVIEAVPKNLGSMNRFPNCEQIHQYDSQKKSITSVPFAVIKLTISPEIIQQVLEHVEDFFKIYEDPSFEYFSTWRLEPTGFYSNLASDCSFVLISDKHFYKGKCSFHENKYHLEGEGILITRNNCYRGNFQNSKAHGFGELKIIDKKEIYKGYWSQGCLVKGEMESSQVHFEGEFLNGVPNGNGKMKIKDKNIQYSGNFTEGKFCDMDGLYSCLKYEYKGGFVQGKKHGPGVLQELKSSSSSTEDSELIRLEGRWENDILIEEQKQ